MKILLILTIVSSFVAFLFLLVPINNASATCIIDVNGTEQCAEPPPSPVTININNRTLAVGETLTITGTINRTMLQTDEPLFIEFFNSTWATAYGPERVEENKNGSYTYHLKLEKKFGSTDQYAVMITHGNNLLDAETGFMFIAGPYDLVINDKTFPINYTITSGKIEKISADVKGKSLDVYFHNTGKLTLVLPRTLIDSISGNNDINFTVLIGEHRQPDKYKKLADFKETQSNKEFRTLVISPPYDVTNPLDLWDVKIIGTKLNDKIQSSNNVHVDPMALWGAHDYILDGTIVEKKVWTDNTIIYNIKINKIFKGSLNSHLITVDGNYIQDYLENGDSALFYINDIDTVSSFQKYQATDYSVKTYKNCDARSLIQISPILPNDPDTLIRAPPIIPWDYKDQCVPNYFAYDPDFWTFRDYKPPLRQFRDHNLPIDLQRCHDDFESIHSKNHPEYIVCVKPETKIKLVKRGWGMSSLVLTNDNSENQPLFYPQKEYVDSIPLVFSNASNENTLGIKARIVNEPDTAIMCPVENCKISPTPHLVLTSQKGSQFVGYEVCHGLFCKKDRVFDGLYVWMVNIPEDYSGASSIMIGHINLGSLSWGKGDIVRIKVIVFPATLLENNVVVRHIDQIMKIDLGNSSIE